MLLKYFLVPIALAVSVLGSPTESSLDDNVAFEACTSEISKAKDEILSFCQKGSSSDVTRKLNEVHKPLAEIAKKFGSLVRVAPKIALKYSNPYIGLLTTFQLILRVIVKYPNILTSCKAILAGFDPEFDSLTSGFKQAGVNVHQALSQASGLQLSTWSTFGFKFQSKYGF